MKKTLSPEMLDEQMAVELPDRAMMALVNVVIFDVLSHNTTTIRLPVGIAANVCGTTVQLLQQQFRQTGTNTCNAVASPTA